MTRRAAVVVPRESKGERTRARVVAAAAPLFNRLGYAGASMSDIIEAAGLEKGGVYRHFESKDALATAAFDHAVALHAAYFRDAIAREPGAVARLVALAEAMAAVGLRPLVDGGCPLLNTAVESDDAHPALRARVQGAMRDLLALVRRLVGDAVARGELAADVDAAAEASVFVATMEGSVMLSRLYQDRAHARRAVAAVRERLAMLRGSAEVRDA